jgi:rubrerythrin
MAEGCSFFAGRQAALLTKHQKELVIIPVFEKDTGCEVLVNTGFDTDQLGTFTRDIPRAGSQLEAARRKAMKGMELLGTDLGLASEGSFGPHPLIPFVPWNLELVLLVDHREKLEIYGESANSETNYAHKLVDNYEQAEEFARRIGFPAHWLVLRPDDDSHEFIIKEVNTWQSLGEGFRKALDNSSTGAVFLETDMRAHANPTRMVNIQKAAEDLVQKIKQQCPRCRVPGFSLVKTKNGLPCEWCERPTGEVKAWVYGCSKCGFTREKRVSRRKRASAGSCPRCNP